MFYSKEDLNAFSIVQFRFIETAFEDNVFTISLNRPEKRNAFTPTMVREIAYALEYANTDGSVWCVVIEARGPIFCAGMDLLVFQNPELDEENKTLPRTIKQVNLGEAFHDLDKPSIAKVEGSVFAGGFLIIAGCTFVVASDNVEFSLPEVKRGLFPMQVMASLLQKMPAGKVLEMCILGKSYTASEAREIGLISHLSSREDVDETCGGLKKMILENSPFAIRKGIEAFKKLPEISGKERYAYLLDQLNRIRNSEDAQEGIAAFKEKRKPEWKNK